MRSSYGFIFDEWWLGPLLQIRVTTRPILTGWYIFMTNTTIACIIFMTSTYYNLVLYTIRVEKWHYNDGRGKYHKTDILWHLLRQLTFSLIGISVIDEYRYPPTVIEVLLIHYVHSSLLSSERRPMLDMSFPRHTRVLPTLHLPVDATRELFGTIVQQLYK